MRSAAPPSRRLGGVVEIGVSAFGAEKGDWAHWGLKVLKVLKSP